MARIPFGYIAVLLMIVGGSTRAEDQTVASEAKPDSQPATAEKPKSDSVNFTCIIVDSATGKGVPDAKIEIQIVLQPGPGQPMKAGEALEIIKRSTDVNGNYDFSLSRELIAKPELFFLLNADGEGYVRSSLGMGVSAIAKAALAGDRLAFHKVTLRRGEELTGLVVDPSGQPLKGIRAEAHSVTLVGGRRRSEFALTHTDDQGRFRLSVPKDSESQVAIIPKNFACSKKFVGKTRGDIGEIQVENGIRVTGVLLGIDRRPVVGVPVNIAQRSGSDVNSGSFSHPFQRGELSDGEGRFTFSPLAPGEYQLTVDGRIHDVLKDESQKSIDVPAIFARKSVTLVNGTEVGPIEIQAVPSVVMRVKFFDSQKNEVNGSRFSISGTMDGQPWTIPPITEVKHSYDLKLPHGLERAQLQLNSGNATAFRYRKETDEMMRGGGFIRNELGTISDDTSLDLFLYKAPTVEIVAVDEQGEAMTQFSVRAMYGSSQRADATNRQEAVAFARKASGGFESVFMLPDEDVTFTINALGYSSMEEKVNLKEGEKKTLKVTLKKMP